MPEAVLAEDSGTTNFDLASIVGLVDVDTPFSQLTFDIGPPGADVALVQVGRVISLTPSQGLRVIIIFVFLSRVGAAGILLLGADRGVLLRPIDFWWKVS